MNRRHRWFPAGLDYYVLSLLLLLLILTSRLDQGRSSSFISTAPKPGPLVICTRAVDMPGSRRCHRAYTVTVSHSVVLHTRKKRKEKSTCDVSSLIYVAFIPQVFLLPRSFPSPGSTPEYSRGRCLVLLRTHGAWPRKKGIYTIQSNPYQTRSDFQARPSQEKKETPIGVHSRVNSIVSKISME